VGREQSTVFVIGAFLAMSGVASAAETGIVHDRRMGFVVKDWFTSVYETKFMDECPEGVAIANDEIWWRRLSRAEKDEQTGKGMIQALNRVGASFARGRNGEHVCLEPGSVDDPPLRIVEGMLSYGIDLDGAADGRASAKTCAHEQFTHPDGTPGIDNQMYRLVGCTYGWRKDVGTVDMNANEMRNTSGLGLILIDVSEVDDPRNDDDVTVTFYRSVDQWTQDSHGHPLPFQTFNIDMVEGKPRYGDSIKAAIKDGVLTTTKAGDVRLPWYGNYIFMHPIIKDLHLKLDIAASGESAAGQVAGYYDLDAFTYYVSGLGAVVPVNGINCPSLIKAAHELADGYPDPATGKCTALSSSYELLAYAAYIRVPGAQPQKTAARQ
jgi:hypothetical protein